MNKRKIIGLVAASASALLVAVVFLCMLVSVKYIGAADHLYAHSRTEIDAPIWHISLQTSITSISICTTEAEAAYVEMYDRENAAYRIAAEDGTLLVEEVGRRTWYEQLGIFPKTPKMTLYLPAGMYGDLSVTSSRGEIEVSSRLLFQHVTILSATGNVTCRASAVEWIAITGATGCVSLEHLVASNIDVLVSTGNIAVSDVTCTKKIALDSPSGNVKVINTTCKSFSSTGKSGNLYMENVVARRYFSIDRTSGNLTLDGCDTGVGYLVTGSGNVTGSWFSSKIFEVKTSSGNKDLPSTTSGGKCRVTTASGNIKMTILDGTE